MLCRGEDVIFDKMKGNTQVVIKDNNGVVTSVQ